MINTSEIASTRLELNNIDANITEFLEKNERKFGGIEDDEDYTTPVWVEYKRLINERKKISNKLAKLLGRGYS